MCGIFGCVGARLRRADVLAALASLRHRGPDGWGVWTADIGSAAATAVWPPDSRRPWPCTPADLAPLDDPQEVLLLNTRLGLCGHGPASRQPMAPTPERVITFNGELYNHLSLRAELERRGARFRSDSDTEVLLAGYREWGPDVVTRLEGPYAFAIWDSRRLFGARDRFGEKPLYVTHHPGQQVFAFSSMPRTLFATGLAGGTVRDDVATRYLFDRVPPTGDATFFDDVRQIPAGCSFDYDPATGSLHIAPSPFAGIDPDPDPDPAADAVILRTALMDSLAARRHANSPVTLCLSGGVDSANLAAAAESSITCYSLTSGSDGVRFPDERQHVAGVATAVPNARVTFLPVGREITVRNFRQFLDDHDEPPLNSGAFLQWLLMRQISRSGTRVVVTGQGADELFWGYPWQIPSYRRDAEWDSVWRTDFGGRAPTDPASEEMVDIDALRYRELFSTRLPQHLRDDDTNSMAHGIESRTPYLSHGVVNFALSLPASRCFRDRTTKYPVRAAFSDVLPERVAWGKAKRGLYVDWAAQWSDPIEESVAQAVATSAVLSRIADVGRLEVELARGDVSPAFRWRLVALAHTEQAAAARVLR